MEQGNKGNLDAVDELFAPGFISHTAAMGEMRGLESYKSFVTMTRTAFPDLHFTVEDQIAEGDKVMTRYTIHGTHQGEMMGIPPTGKSFTISGIGLDRIENGKFVESWESFDQLGMLQQLGVVPVLGQAS